MSALPATWFATWLATSALNSLTCLAHPIFAEMPCTPLAHSSHFLGQNQLEASPIQLLTLEFILRSSHLLEIRYATAFLRSRHIREVYFTI